MRGVPSSVPENPEVALFNQLEDELGDTFGAILTETGLDEPPAGGVGLLDRPDQLDLSQLDLVALTNEEITIKNDGPDVAAEADTYLEQRKFVNEMLMILAKSDDLDAAVKAYRLLHARDGQQRRFIEQMLENDPTAIHLSPSEYAELAKKWQLKIPGHQNQGF